MGILDSDPMDQGNLFLLSGECWMCLWFILLGPLSAFFFPGGLISMDDISRLLVLWLPIGFGSWEHLQEIRGREERDIRALIYHRIAAFITQIAELLSGDPLITLSVQDSVTSLFLFIPVSRSDNYTSLVPVLVISFYPDLIFVNCPLLTLFKLSKSC